MRNCCSRDLLDPGSHVRDFDPIWGATPTAPFLPHHSHPHSGSHIRTPAFVRQVRDFDPIWLDDFLDYLIVPFSSQAPAPRARPPVQHPPRTTPPPPPPPRTPSRRAARCPARCSARLPPARLLAAAAQSGPLAKSDEILSLIERYLGEMGGAASSRDIGRFLQGETVHHASN